MSYMDERRNQKMFGKKPEIKKTYVIPKKSAKKIKEEAEEKERLGGDDSELKKWYKNRMKQLTGRCAETGLVTETKIYQYAIMSICHLLPKRLCPSVATHPLNFIELNVDIHYKFDNSKWEDIEKWGCYETIRDRLIMVYPDLDPLERRHFPEKVLDYMNKHDFI